MAHSKPESLKDLEPQFKEIRSLEGLKEKKPGIFYWKAVSFLHFHEGDGVRWADVKTQAGWLRLEIDFNASPQERKAFVKAASEAHFILSKGTKNK